MEQTTLYFRQGSSDKIYQASIEPKDGKFVVNFAFGRRGSTLTTGTKTPVAVDYGAAKAIYDKLVKEKQAKGYTVGEDGAPYQHTEKEHSGIQCQLLDPIGDDQIEKLLTDPEYWMQEKWDGRRLLIKKQGDKITGINRLGFTVGLPESIMASAAKCPLDFILDGEAIGDMLCVFDMLFIGTQDVREKGYWQRYPWMLNLLASFQHPHIHVTETAFNEGDKRRILNELKERGSEGVVFKHHRTPYLGGRSGSQFKFKFCETASFIVGKVNAKRSVSLLLFDGDRIKSAGNVTIPPNFDVPTTGQVVECRYLYAFRESGSIFQPVFLGVRDDIRAEECVTSQLKYKAEPKEEAA